MVFLTADDHNSRVMTLKYQPDPNNPARWETLPNAFQVLAGPIGAVGPDQKPYEVDRSLAEEFPTVVANAAKQNQELASYQVPEIGLVNYPGLSKVYRQFDPNAETNPKSVDFYTPNTFGYTTLDWDSAKALTVTYWGIKSYAANAYPVDSETPSKILEFTINPR